MTNKELDEYEKKILFGLSSVNPKPLFPQEIPEPSSIEDGSGIKSKKFKDLKERLSLDSQKRVEQFIEDTLKNSK